MFNGRNFFDYITSFSKIITLVWLAIWVETILFTQIATICNCGDTAAIQYINDNVVQIGLVICGFYFCTKTIENVAQGVEIFYSEVKYKKLEVAATPINTPNVSNGNIDPYLPLDKPIVEPDQAQNEGVLPW